jgi:hypothetical protein
VKKRMTDERLALLDNMLPNMKLTERLVMEIFESLKAERRAFHSLLQRRDKQLLEQRDRIKELERE